MFPLSMTIEVIIVKHAALLGVLSIANGWHVWLLDSPDSLTLPMFLSIANGQHVWLLDSLNVLTNSPLLHGAAKLSMFGFNRSGSLGGVMF